MPAGSFSGGMDTCQGDSDGLPLTGASWQAAFPGGGPAEAGDPGTDARVTLSRPATRQIGP
ncbi:hypothetical protein E4K10_33060 [Streptomyces sp. T1317-0309]|nr:hypothetical protein E4K10_33060 [Streptomyces sp. T1317-0309]